MKVHLDLVTVYHNDQTQRLHTRLRDAIVEHEPTGGYRLIGVDNRTRNRGFSAGCNTGAFHPDATAPIIGFLNPDVEVVGPFIKAVRQTLAPPVVITGSRFNKAQLELDHWGVRDWVCGACLFVDRKWYQSVGGFDEQFVWGWEESDLIRQAETSGHVCKSIALPIHHESPTENSPKDTAYKQFHFEQGQKRYARKWGRRRI